MKKIASVFLPLIFLAVLVHALIPTERMDDSNKDNSIILPASLIEIGEEAFAGTAAETVIISNSALVIGDRAFSKSPSLKSIFIPESVKAIGDNTFEDSSNVIIRGTKSSYANTWAQIHNIPFRDKDTSLTWLMKLGKLLQRSMLLPFSLSCIGPDVHQLQKRKKRKYERSLRPQDRPELHPIDYRFP